MAHLTPETAVKNKVIEQLNKLSDGGAPLLVFRRDASGPNYKKGLPDLYVVVGPYHLEIELKAPATGHLSVMQEKWKARFARLGVPYLVSAKPDEVISFVEEYIKKTAAY